ncbi:hypothetical protein ACP70R_015262 [Stipagrostis hirtigluma subsp. patula]
MSLVGPCIYQRSKRKFDPIESVSTRSISRIYVSSASDAVSPPRETSHIFAMTRLRGARPAVSKMARCRRNAAPPSPPSVTGGGLWLSADLPGDGLDRPTKRTCLAAGQGDYIDTLPDDILVNVISRLAIRDAVATGGVSARWRHLWKHVRRLILLPNRIRLRGDDDEGSSPPSTEAEQRDADSQEDAQVARLADAASSVLRHHRGTGVDKLVFQLPLTSRHAAVLDQAVAFAAAAGAPELHFTLAAGKRRHATPPPPYDFPHWRFAGAGGSRLQILLLGNVRLAGAAQQRSLEGLAQLTYLSLTGVTVDDAGVADILSACDSLLIVELRDCPQLAHLTASHARLRVLDVDGCGGLKSVTIRSSSLLQLAYRGHKVDIKYDHAPAIAKLRVLFRKGSQCPLDCVGGDLPELRHLFLQFPSPVHASCNRTFACLSKMVLLLMKTPWRERVLSVANLLCAAPLVDELRVEVYGDLPVAPPNKPPMFIRWPEHCSPETLGSVAIGGFSGEPELVELAFFLLRRSPALRALAIDTHRRHLRSGDKGWSREEREYPVRCYYARGVAWTHLAPKIPSTVKFTIL